ncbi:hypothetical protein JHV675_51270 [Mycobacterium avium subsp. hominissuis]
MTAAALATDPMVATNAEGANMDAGLVAALAANRGARLAALEVDEMGSHGDCSGDIRRNLRPAHREHPRRGLIPDRLPVAGVRDAPV